MIPALDSEPILLGEALVHTIDWLPEIANTLGLKLEYNEIMHKGPAFYELQSVLPMDLRNNV